MNIKTVSTKGKQICKIMECLLNSEESLNLMKVKTVNKKSVEIDIYIMLSKGATVELPTKHGI